MQHPASLRLQFAMRFAYLSRTRLKCRQLVPKISAACIQLIFFATPSHYLVSIHRPLP